MRQLLTSGIATVTKDGKLVVCCTTILVIRCTYKGKVLRVVNGAITIILPMDLKSIAPEQLCEYNLDLVIEVDPKRSRNVQVKAMAGLSSAPAPVRSQEHCVPIAGANGDGTFTVTVCVSATDEEHLSKFADKVYRMGALALCANININPTEITDNGDGRYSMMLKNEGVLNFTFHYVIAEEAMNLLQTAQNDADCAVGRAKIEKMMQDGLVAMMKDSLPKETPVCTSYSEPVASTNDSAYSVFGSRQVASPVPTCDGSNWTDDANETVLAPLSREMEANAFSGIVIAPSRKEQKALEKARRGVEQARCAEEEAQRLKKKQLEQEAEEAQRQKDMEDMARVEQEREEAENKAAEARAQHNALVQEFQSIDPIARIAVGLETLEQWLEEPETWRVAIATIMTSAVQPVYPIFVKSQNFEYLNAMVRLAQTNGIRLKIEQSGRFFLLNVALLLNKGILTLRISARGNQLICGHLMGDGTLQHGCIANVDSTSYPAVVAIFPDMVKTIQQVVQTREELRAEKHHVQHYPALFAVPQPLFDCYGWLVGYSVPPSAYPPRA